MTLAPIFVHSLFRAGSTYLFGAFRRSPAGYWCYQEPLHEYLRHAAAAPERLLDIDFVVGSALRHPRLNKPYFWELYEVRNTVASLFRKELSYDSFFADESPPSLVLTATYLQALLDAARSRPMLQCCRTFGRAVALKRLIGGVHIHLWRNPWDQWWSYQVDNYFEATSQLILNAADLPLVLRDVKERCGIADFHDADIAAEIAHASDHRLNARATYLAFYALWLYAFVELEAVAEVSINIDLLSASAAYRRRTLGALRAAGITDIDFSDCRIAQGGFGARDRAFFEDVEAEVRSLFEEHGYTAAALDGVWRSRAAALPRARHAASRSIEDAERARDAARRQIDRTANALSDRAAQEAALRNAQTFAATLEAAGAARHDELAQRQREIAALARDAADVRQRLDAQANELADAQRQLAARADELQRARAAEAARRDELEQRQQKIAALTRDAADVRRQLDAAGALAVARDAEIRNLTARLASGDRELAEARAGAQLQHQALQNTREYAGNLESELSSARSRIDELHREMTRWCGVANDINRHLQAVYATRSWRLTAPLRWIKANLRFSRLATAGDSALAAAIRRAMGRRLAQAARFLQTRPALKLAAVRLIARFPDQHHRLRSLVFRHGAEPVGVAAPAARSNGLPQPADLVHIAEPDGVDGWSPAVLRTYRLLVAAQETSALETTSSRATPSD